jgi:hypothetical protein
MRFSERYGYKPVRKIIQIDSMNDELKTALWNVLTLFLWDRLNGVRAIHGIPSGPMKDLFSQLWLDFFKKPVDTIPDNWGDLRRQLRHTFFSEFAWFEVYDFIEFVWQSYPVHTKDAFLTACNLCLEREVSAYRLVSGLFARITDEEEVAEIEDALETAEGSVRTHLHRSLELLSDRENPDYRNSIKESISAVESLVSITLGQKGTLGQLIRKLDKEIELHPALQSAFSSLYGYTSDEGGIRHAILEAKRITFEDAKFFLVVCSAFVNFVNARMAAIQP